MYYMKKHILFMAIFALHCLTMSAQQIKISGKVTDESNYPLPGATVSILESGNGTSTNLEGEYSSHAGNQTSIQLYRLCIPNNTRG
mgnify:CR=1 FL=1